MMSILEEHQQVEDEKHPNELKSLDLQRILVEVYPQPTHEDKNNEDDENSTTNSSSLHAQEIFLEINKAEPVKLVDLPGTHLSQGDRKTINYGAQRLQERYPEMFSNSSRCRAPHLHLDNLRDALFASEVIKRHNLKSPKALVTWLMQQNELLKEKYTSDDGKKEKVNPTALKKAIKYDFYLGLDSSWLFQ